MAASSRLWRSQRAYDQQQAYYERMLGRVRVPYDTRYVETRHGQTYVLTAGQPDNPPLILWHGMNACTTMWVNEINVFADEYFVVSADGVGDTGRSAPNRLNRKSDQHGEWASDVMAALGLLRAFHVGTSGGGWMILKLAQVDVTKIAAAVLMSTGGFIPVSSTVMRRILPYMLISPIIGRTRLAEKFLDLMSPPGYHATPEDIELFELMFSFKSEYGVPPFSDEKLAMMTAPTLLLMGAYEVPFSPVEKVIERAKRTLPHLVAAEVLPGVGHAMNAENPDLVHGKIRAFLKRHEATL